MTYNLNFRKLTSQPMPNSVDLQLWLFKTYDEMRNTTATANEPARDFNSYVTFAAAALHLVKLADELYQVHGPDKDMQFANQTGSIPLDEDDEDDYLNDEDLATFENDYSDEDLGNE